MKLWWLLIFAFAATLAASPFSSIQIEHQQIGLEFESSFSQQQKQLMHRWLTEVARSITKVHGELPFDHFVIKLRQSKRGGPVPWGQVNRGSPVSVSLTVNPTHGYARLISDWTAFHELSHLLLPYRGYGDLWLSEGLASYYQNIVQARVGLIDERQMWQKLYAGLERGRRSGTSQLTLRQASASLRRSREYMRVYWSGVLFWLEVDVALRTNHSTSLDNFLSHLKRCCQKQKLSAEQIVTKLDQYADTSSFMLAFKRARESHAIDDYSVLLARLGVLDEEKSVRLAPNAELLSVRSDIYSGAVSEKALSRN